MVHVQCIEGIQEEQTIAELNLPMTLRGLSQPSISILENKKFQSNVAQAAFHYSTLLLYSCKVKLV